MKNTQTIGNLCREVITGATNILFDKEATENANHKLLMGASLNPLGEVKSGALVPIDVKEGRDPSKFLLQSGDVVLLAKGSTPRAAIISEEVSKQNVVASANFLLLRPDTSQVRGEVLVAYLNSPLGQSQLAALSTGSIVTNISAASIKKFTVPVPTVTSQDKVAELFWARNHAYRDAIAVAEQQKIVANVCIENLMMGDAA
ncbi:restriction endonuclease subunit S [Ferrimonas gelatinilytica]|uniref:Type I restriction modification DNA specificity domain-containing protein n=1 Tax=Ferrimonas gelatinilytica TaxID=1255257 RepID=A0ABP9S8C3_9GAMM